MLTCVPTDRELQVLRAIAQHGTIDAAARALFLSRHTIDWYLDNLRRKTGLRHLPQIIAWAASANLLGDAFPW